MRSPVTTAGVDRRGQVAVVLGAANGLGLGLARRFGLDGARLVLADIAAPALSAVQEEMLAAGMDVVACQTDISDASQVDALVRLALEHHGRIDLVCNAVGVSGHDQHRIWELPEEDWRWVFDVNVWGVLNVIRSFTSVLIDAGRGHIVNTASSITFSSRGGYAPYDASKHAVLSLCETLAHELAAMGSSVRSSVLIPGAIRSRLYDSELNRQPQYGQGVTTEEQREDMRVYLEQHGADPDMLAEIVDSQIAEGRFYVFGRAEDLAYAEAKLDEVRAGFLRATNFRRRSGPGSVAPGDR